jgi:hypothetical protein
MEQIAPISGILNNAYILYCLAMGVWAGLLWLREEPLSGNFWGAMWLASFLAAISLAVGIIRALGGAQFRTVYWLYEFYFILVLPGTFALLRGRDDRGAAAVFAGVAIFSAFAAISTGDRNIILNQPAATLLIAPAFTHPQSSLGLWLGNLLR